MSGGDPADADQAGPHLTNLTNLTNLADLLAGAPPEAWGRSVLAVAAMHEPDRHGRCRYCRPDRTDRRWWRRPPTRPCPTRRMLLAQITATLASPRWTPA